MCSDAVKSHCTLEQSMVGSLSSNSRDILDWFLVEKSRQPTQNGFIAGERLLCNFLKNVKKITVDLQNKKGFVLPCSAVLSE